MGCLGESRRELRRTVVNTNWVATLEAVRAGSELVAPGFAEKDGLLLFENRYVLPNDKSLKLAVLSANHDSKVAGHFGQFKTLERIRQNFFWSKM